MRALGSRAKTQQQIASVFRSENPVFELGDHKFKQITSNSVNTTRVFDASQLSDAQLKKEVFAYAERLGGGKLQAARNAPGRWHIKIADGTTINVRSVSSSHLTDSTQPRWTLEIVKDRKLNKMIGEKPHNLNKKERLNSNE